jgi:C_GCAxxG_C_C family probable redox protein
MHESWRDFMSNEELIKKAYDLGFKNEREYRGCAQCAISAIQDVLGAQNDFVYKAGSGLAGGAGECTDGLCGAYSGAIIMMSLFFGRERKDEATEFGRKEKYDSFHMASALHEKFIEKYGSVICSGIQKKIFGRSFDLRKDKDKQAFRNAGAHELDDKCCMVVGDGARWGTELILNEIANRGISLQDFNYLHYTSRR